MGSAHGVVMEPKGYYEQIARAVRSLESGIVFSLEDLRRLVPHSRQSVQKFVSEKTKSGWLERIARNRYRRGGIVIKTTLPKGLVAEAVWAVLFTSKDQKPMRLPEVVGEAESYIGRPGASLYGSISSTLSKWHRDGYLYRTGRNREYAYQIRTGITERPVSRH